MWQSGLVDPHPSFRGRAALRRVIAHKLPFVIFAAVRLRWRRATKVGCEDVVATKAELSAGEAELKVCSKAPAESQRVVDGGRRMPRQELDPLS